MQLRKIPLAFDQLAAGVSLSSTQRTIALERFSYAQDVSISSSNRPDRVSCTGDSIPLSWRTDGKWVWTQEVEAYVERYAMLVPTSFLDDPDEHPALTENQLDEVNKELMQLPLLEDNTQPQIGTYLRSWLDRGLTVNLYSVLRALGGPERDSYRTMLASSTSARNMALAELHHVLRAGSFTTVDAELLLSIPCTDHRVAQEHLARLAAALSDQRI